MIRLAVLVRLIADINCVNYLSMLAEIARQVESLFMLPQATDHKQLVPLD
ncbi:hypothetical protein NIES2098_01550 [Calothrix sp. NIES-2098]|nr:hypothetical protein NIES2098_01550 [Calothrix sp. NIES-2098]